MDSVIKRDTHPKATIRDTKLTDGSHVFDVILWDGGAQVCAINVPNEDVAYRLWGVINNSANAITEYESEWSTFEAIRLECEKPVPRGC